MMNDEQKKALPFDPTVGPHADAPAAEPLDDEEPDDGEWDDADDLDDEADAELEVKEYTIDEKDITNAVESDPKSLRRTNALPPSAWIESPARVTLPIEAIKTLRQVGKLANLNYKKISYVKLMLLPGPGLLLVTPTKETDPKAVPARRIGKGPLSFNANLVLQPAQMTIEQGYCERFKVGLTKDSPIGPALVIDLNHSVQTRRRHRETASTKV
jgi:hypothetical protein